ncbi:hypothetical protein C8R46DRAFT_1055556 [Mycena filopes]|nr:hypothetical protein C8R46DRAFT_1055556 [Mycena filopes]
MPLPSFLKFSLVPGALVTAEILSECAALFSANYGVWNSEVAAPLKPGGRVKMSSTKLRSQCLADPVNTSLALCTTKEGTIIGHAFATVWEYAPGETVCWITQLVVAQQYRQRTIASSLLCMLPEANIMGLATSHPAASLALAAAAGDNMRKVDLEFIKTTAPLVLETSPIGYLQSASFRGRLFNESDNSMTSCLFTDFPVDHGEVLAARRKWEERNDMEWPLGQLGERHEYLYIAKVVHTL